MKTKYLKNLLFLCMSACLFIACNDKEEKENEFKGTDNSIVSFTLTQNGVTYKGALTTDEIIITVAENVSLENATVAIQLSEHATLSPDPEKVTNWDEELEFTVTSLNETNKRYTYQVNRSKVVSAADVTLTTQEEVNAFAETGISIIDGHLIIGKETGESANDTITDLSPLSTLKQITYNLVINPTYGGENLNGMENMERIGSLSIGSIPSLKTLSLPSLEIINQTFSINNTDIEEISIPALSYAGGDFNLNTPGLVSLELNNLETIDGSFDLYSISLSTLQMEGIQNIHKDMILQSNQTSSPMIDLSFPSLKDIQGTLSIKQWNLSSFHFPSLISVGNLETQTLRNIEEIVFESLEKCQGVINFPLATTTPNPPVEKYLETISFPALVSAGSILIGNTTTYSLYYPLKKLNFPLLQEVEGEFRMGAITIETIDNFPLLASTGNMGLRSLPDVEKIEFPSLKEINGELRMVNMSAAQNQKIETLDDFFPSLEKIEGNIIIQYYAALYSYRGLQKVIENGWDRSWSSNTGCAYKATKALIQAGQYEPIIP